MRTNNYDAATGKLTIEPVRAEAFQQNLKHYSEIFTNGNKEYAIQKNAQSDPEKLRLMNSFFFWTSWASAANRPNNTISYTSNFPSEPLVDNVPTGSTIIWTGVSVIVLIAGLGGMIWFFVSTREEEKFDGVPERDPLIGMDITPSQKSNGQILFYRHFAVSFANNSGRNHSTLWR